MANRLGGGRGGRPRKPRHMHLVDGTFRKDRHGDKDQAQAEVAANKEAPLLTAPTFLGDAARQAWRRVAPLLRARGHVAKLDREVLAGLCEAWGEIVECSAGIAFEVEQARATLLLPDLLPGDVLTSDLPTGMSVVDYRHARARAKLEAQRVIAYKGLQLPGKSEGTWVRNPSVVTRAAAWKRLRDFAVEFGMSPQSAARLLGGGGGRGGGSGEGEGQGQGAYPDDLGDRTAT